MLGNLENAKMSNGLSKDILKPNHKSQMAKCGKLLRVLKNITFNYQKLKIFVIFFANSKL